MTTRVSTANPQAAIAADSQFSLATTWRFNTPIQAVWQAIKDVERWPKWWPYVASVTTLAAGEESGLGATHRLVWRSALPYRMTFDTQVTLMQAPFAIDARASGDLTGQGRWRLSRMGGATVARYQWDVIPTRPWMRRVAPLARSVFEWNHERVMRAGEAGLTAWLANSRRG